MNTLQNNQVSSLLKDSPVALPDKAPVAAGSTKLGKDEFLKLLLEQLKSQDPTQPVDNQAFVAQLAQFSQLEQLQTSNSTLESVLLAQYSATQMAGQTAGASLLGREVRYTVDSVELQEGSTPAFDVTIPRAVGKVSLLVSDAKGRVVRTVDYPAQAAGQLRVSWDGKDTSGQPMPPGTYQVRVVAEDQTNRRQSVPVTGASQGRVTGLTFESGTAQLVINGVRIPLSKVLEVTAAPTNTNQENAT